MEFPIEKLIQFLIVLSVHWVQYLPLYSIDTHTHSDTFHSLVTQILLM